MAETNAIVGGKEMDFKYKDCKKEMDMVNKAFIETMIEGDANGRGFQYPIQLIPLPGILTGLIPKITVCCLKSCKYVCCTFPTTSTATWSQATSVPCAAVSVWI